MSTRKRRIWVRVIVVALVAAVFAGGSLMMNAWWLAMEGAADICFEREPRERSVRTPPEGLGFRCVYRDGPQEIRGSKVWIWNRS